jgi:hypothetical protein
MRIDALMLASCARRTSVHGTFRSGCDEAARPRIRHAAHGEEPAAITHSDFRHM